MFTTNNAKMPDVPFHEATNYAELIELAEQFLIKSPGLAVVQAGAIEAIGKLLHSRLTNITVPYLTGHPVTAMYVDLVRTSFQGGFFMRDINNLKQAVKWQYHKLGGSAAIHALTDDLFMGADSAVPGIAITDAEHYRDQLTKSKIPYLMQRMESLKEFCDSAKFQECGELFAALRSDGVIEWANAKDLARIFPVSFGGDPLLKKACLALMFLATNLGVPLYKVRLPVPIDTRLPRALREYQAIHVPPLVWEATTAFLQADSHSIMAVRCATLVATDRLMKQTGYPSLVIDQLLFHAKPQTSMKPMCVDTTWF